MNPARPLPSNRRVATPTPEPGRERPRAAQRDEKPWDPDALWRGLRLAGRIALAVLVIAVGVAAAVGARRYVTHSPRFALQTLKIEGAARRTPEQIAALAGVAIGQNVVEVDLDAARAKLEGDPWIERATIVRRLPATIEIEIAERDAAAIVALPSGTWLATSRGELFKKIEAGDPSDLPVVTGLTEVDAAGDRESTAQLVRRALDLAADVERVGLFGGRVQELHVDVDGAITTVLARRGSSPEAGSRAQVRVVFGKSGHRAKVRLAAKIEHELQRRSARPTVVFLDDDVHPDRVVVRLVAALPPATVTIDGPQGPAAQGGGPTP